MSYQYESIGVLELRLLAKLGCKEICKKTGCIKICKIFASKLGFKLVVMRGFQKGITLGGRGPWKNSYCGFEKMGCK